MNGSSDPVRLLQLRTELNHSLASFIQRTSAVTSTLGSRRRLSQAGVGDDPPQTEHAAQRRRAGQAVDAKSAGGDPKGGASFLDNERGVRALAKEIKRLIAEDIRRGIGFEG